MWKICSAGRSTSGVLVGQAADERVGFARVQHHRAEVVAIAQQGARPCQRHAAALAQFVKRLDEAGAQAVIVGIDDLRDEAQAQLTDLFEDALAPSDQDRGGDAVISDLRRGADDLRLFTFSIEDAFGCASAGFVEQTAARLLPDALTGD